MKKLKVLTTVTMILVIIIGSIPGLEECLSELLLFHNPDAQNWKVVVTCIPSILVGILIGCFLSKYLMGIWLKTDKSLGFISIIIFFITFIAGMIALMVAWEITWIIPKLFGWKYTGEFNPCENLLDHYLLMLLYGGILVAIASIINGLFSFTYLKFSKR